MLKRFGNSNIIQRYRELIQIGNILEEKEREYRQYIIEDLIENVYRPIDPNPVVQPDSPAEIYFWSVFINNQTFELNKDHLFSINQMVQLCNATIIGNYITMYCCLRYEILIFIDEEKANTIEKSKSAYIKLPFNMDGVKHIKIGVNSSIEEVIKNHENLSVHIYIFKRNQGNLFFFFDEVVYEKDYTIYDESYLIFKSLVRFNPAYIWH